MLSIATDSLSCVERAFWAPQATLFQTSAGSSLFPSISARLCFISEKFSRLICLCNLFAPKTTGYFFGLMHFLMHEKTVNIVLNLSSLFQHQNDFFSSLVFLEQRKMWESRAKMSRITGKNAHFTWLNKSTWHFFPNLCKFSSLSTFGSNDDTVHLVMDQMLALTWFSAEKQD